MDGTASSDANDDTLVYEWSVIGLTGRPVQGEFSSPHEAITSVSLNKVRTSFLPEDLLRDYHVISLTNLDSRADIAGRALVGGKLNGLASNFGLGLTNPPGVEVLIVGGDIKGDAKNVAPGGNARYGGKLFTSVMVSGGGEVVKDDTISVSAEQASLASLSADLAALQATSTLVLPQSVAGTASLNAIPGATGVAVFSVPSGNDLFHNNLVQQIDVLANGSRAIVVNIGGKSVHFDNGDFTALSNSISSRQRIIWNFHEATALYFDKPFSGSVLAPFAHLNNTAPIYGAVAVERFIQHADLLLPGFEGGAIIDTGEIGPAPAGVLQIAVNDGSATSYDTILLSQGDIAPVARPGNGIVARVGDSVTLDGGASSDANGDALTFNWSLIHRPQNSTSNLSGPDTQMPQLQLDKRGVYIVQLIVTAGGLVSEPQTISVTATNEDPQFISAAVTAAQVAVPYLYDVMAFDPDGDALTYSLTQSPAGMTINTSSGVISWTPDAAGAVTVGIKVEDGRDGIATQTYTLVIDQPSGNLPPEITITGDPNVVLGQSVTLQVAANDPEGEPVQLSIQPIPLPQGSSFDPETGMFSFRPVAGQLGTFLFTFIAGDGALTAAQDVNIAVTQGDPNALTRIIGTVIDANEKALGNTLGISSATVSYDGISATTGSGGSFTLDLSSLVVQATVTLGGTNPQALQSGDILAGSGLVFADGATAPPATNGSLYGSAFKAITVFIGVDNTLDVPISLAQLGTGSNAVNSGVETVINDASTGVALTIPADSLTNPDGSPFDGAITVSEVPVDSSNLPGDVRSCKAFSLDPKALDLAEPVRPTVPNADALPAGTKAVLWILDTTLGQYRRAGLGVVTADASKIEIISGGIPATTEFFATPISVLAQATDDQSKSTYVPSLLGTGNHQQAVSITGYTSVGSQRSISTLYNSATASPRTLISSEILIPAAAAIPPTFEIEVAIGGIKMPGKVVSQTSQPQNPTDPGLVQGQVEKIVLQVAVDASLLGTGRYDYTMSVFSVFGCSAIAFEQNGKLFINNRDTSPYGTGWKVTELQKLDIQPDGAALVEEIDGTLTSFEKSKAVAAFDKADFQTAVAPANHIDVADFNRDGRPDIAILEGEASSVVVFINTGGTNFIRGAEVVMGQPYVGEITDSSFGTDITDIAAGDYNGDGIADLLVSRQFSNDVAVAYGRGDGSFDDPVTIDTPGSSFSIDTADFNKDGVLDVLLYSGGRFGGIFGNTKILINDDNGNLTQVANTNLTFGARAIAGDFDGDGDIEAVGDDALYILNKLPDGSYAQINGGNLGVKSQFQRVTIDSARLNRDDHSDFAVVGNDAAVHVYLTTKDAFSYQRTPLSLSTLGTTPRSLAFFDIDGDGDDDLFVREVEQTSRLLLFRNLGEGQMGPAELLPIGHNAQEFRFTDMDADGLKDLIILERNNLIVLYGREDANGKYLAPGADFTSLEQNAAGDYVRSYTDGTVVTFNAQGLHTSTTDANGNVTAYTYDAEGRITSITDPAGLVTAFTYHGDGRLASTTTPDGRITLFEYDANGDIITIEQPDTTGLAYTYDAFGNMTGYTDERGSAITYEYGAGGIFSAAHLPDGSSITLEIAKSLGLADLGGTDEAQYVRPEDRVTKINDGNGNLTTTEVNEWGAPIVITDAIGRTSTFKRNSDNRVTLSNVPSDTAPQGFIETEIDYDERGNVTRKHEFTTRSNLFAEKFKRREMLFEYEPEFNRMTRKREQYDLGVNPVYEETLYEYNATGNLTKRTDGVGSETSYTYNTQGLRTSTTDARGHATTYTYDAFGRLTIITDALGTNYRQVLDGRGNPLLRISGEGLPEEQRESFTYDSLNRRLTAQNGEGETTQFAYDENGNLGGIKDPTGVETLRTFDTLNRITAITDPALGTTTFTYDNNSNVTKVTDPSGNETNVVYDAVNRVASSTDANGQQSSYAYDNRDNLLSVTDGNGHTTTFAYDHFGRMSNRTTANGDLWTFTYNIRGDRTSVKPSGRSSVGYRYDVIGRLTDQDRFSGDLSTRRFFTYDAASNLLTAKTGYTDTLTYTYDELNRLTNVVTPGSQGYTLAYGYDALGRRTVMSDDKGAATAYTYDRADRLTSVTAPSGKVVEMDHDAAGRRILTKFPNGLETRTGFDATPGVGGTARLTSIAHGITSATGNGGTALDTLLGAFTYAYTARGNISSIGERNRTRSFTYDALQRLTQVGDGTAQPTETYTFDAEGNRITTHASSLHITDPANRLTEDEHYIYEFSSAGNMVKKASKATGVELRMTYNDIDQLRFIGEYASPGATTYTWQHDYFYDAFGRRRYILRRDGTNQSRYFAHDGWDVVRLKQNLPFNREQAYQWIVRRQGFGV